MKSFSVTVPGKWILAGEHAVLRGVPALVFPLRSRTLQLSYVANNDQDLILNLQGDHGRDLQVLVWGVVDRACALKKIQRSALHGELSLTSSIPVGAGMGASAALCVAIARWLCFLKIVEEAELFEFARTLENLFHGESSGVDIAVSLSAAGLHYERNGERRALHPAWQPQWYISYSGQRGITFECVNKVKEMIAADPVRGAELDARMREAVGICEKALSASGPGEGLPLLKTGIDQACDVFRSWGLTEGAPDAHMQMLLEHGAYAVKPTGSGGGGYVLSVWTETPDAELLRQLIPC
jgi:mevalonate kinase